MCCSLPVHKKSPQESETPEGNSASGRPLQCDRPEPHGTCTDGRAQARVRIRTLLSCGLQCASFLDSGSLDACCTARPRCRHAVSLDAEVRRRGTRRACGDDAAPISPRVTKG